MADPAGDSPQPRTRTVSCEVALDVRQQAELVWSVAVADGPELASEELTVTVDGSPVPVEELRVDDGGRLHLCTAPPGQLRLTYHAEVTGAAAPAKVDPVDDIVYRRPSRYAESDELGRSSPTSRARSCSTRSAPGSAPSCTTSAAPAGTPTVPPRR
jgi:hypothetical protein